MLSLPLFCVTKLIRRLGFSDLDRRSQSARTVVESVVRTKQNGRETNPLLKKSILLGWIPCIQVYLASNKGAHDPDVRELGERGRGVGTQGRPDD